MKKVSLSIPTELYEQYKMLSDIENYTIASELRHALEDWMQTFGVAAIHVSTGIELDPTMKDSPVQSILNVKSATVTVN